MQGNAKLESALKSMTEISDLVSKSVDEMQGIFSNIHIERSADNIFEEVDRVCADSINKFNNQLEKVVIDKNLKEIYLKVFRDKVNEAGDYLISKVGSQLTVAKDNEDLYISKAMGGNLCLSYAMSIGDHGLTSSEKEKLLRAAADGGHPEACNEISIWYEVGRHVDQSDHLAEHYSNMAYRLFNTQAELYVEARSQIENALRDRQEDEVCKIILSWIEDRRSPANEIIMSRIATNIFKEILTIANHNVSGYSVILKEALSLQENSKSAHHDSEVQTILMNMDRIIVSQVNMEYKGLSGDKKYKENKTRLNKLKTRLGER